jgi:ABC-2 type transport system ATP-binding protein
MAAQIRFTLPDGLELDELPAGLRDATHMDGGEVSLTSTSPLADVHALADWALGRGIDLPDLDVHRPTLEDVYLSLVDA